MPDDPDLQTTAYIPRSQQFGSMGDPGYFTGNAPPVPPPAPYASGRSPAVNPGFSAPPIYPQAGAAPPITANVSEAPRPAPMAAPPITQRAAMAAAVPSGPVEAAATGSFGAQPLGPPAPAPAFGGGNEGGLPLAARGYTTPPPAYAGGGEGGMGYAGRGYAGTQETAATGAQMTGPPRGPIVGSAAIDFGNQHVMGTPTVQARNQTYAQSDLDRLGSGGNPEALAAVKAQYAASQAQDRADQQQAYEARGRGMQENIAFGEQYKGGMNAFDRANQERVARINARGREVFGPQSSRMAGTSDAERAAAAGRGAANEPSTRDFFKEAGHAQDMVTSARKAVGDEKTAKLEREGKTVDIEGKKADIKTKGVETETKQQTLEGQKQIAALRAKIDKLPPGKEKEDAIRQLYAYEGKAGAHQAKFIMGEQPFGEPDKITGQQGKIRVPVNSETGEYLHPPGGGTITGQPAAAGAAKGPYTDVAAAHLDAKKAIAAGMPVDEVNKRLIAGGYPAVQ